MIIKKHFLFIFIFGLVFTTFIVGCGEDDEEPDVDDTLVHGSWEIETVDGITFEQAFNVGVGVQEGLELDAELIANDWEFNEDGTWSWYFEFKTEANISEPVYSIKSHQDYTVNGTYTVDGSNMTVTEKDVILNSDVTLEPEETLELLGLNGEMLEAQAEQDLEKTSSEILFDEEIDCTWSVDDDKLTLTHPDGVIVLKKK